jgi:quinoprotein glucose dehydrogenase
MKLRTTLPRLRNTLLPAVALFACTASQSSSTHPVTVGLQDSVPREYQEVAARIRTFIASDSATAVSVAVVRDGRIVWEQGFGMANISQNMGATTASIYPVASVSKSLTATAVMLLVERGKIELDAPASRYLEPGLVRAYVGSEDSMTVRTLLNMTAGIPHLVRFYWRDAGEKPLGEENLLRQFGFAAFPPGRAFHYSNLSFEVLRHIVTRVSGVPFATFMETEIFAPLRMTHSALALSQEQESFEALPYPRASTNPLPLGGLEPAGGAGFHSSAHDLVLLASALMSKPLAGHRTILSPGTNARMWDFRPLGYYGLGWWRDPRDSSHITVLADGSATGGAATLAIIPSQSLAVAVLMSRGSESAFDIAGQLVRASLPPGGAREVGIPLPLRRPVEKPFVPTEEWRGIWVGTVRIPEGTIPFRLDMRGDSLFAQLGNNPRAPVKSPTLTSGLLEGTVAGTVLTEGTRKYPHEIGLSLRKDGAQLEGYLMAQSVGARTHFVLPYFTQLARQATQSGAGDWPTYGRDAGGGRFSPLASITRENVHLLREAWRFSTGPNSIEATTNPAEGNTPNFEATPIVVDGRMYLSTPLGRVFALDPSSGGVLWSFDANVDTRGNYGDNANRGVATWLDIEAAESASCRRRIFLATIDARLITLDARDGQPCTDFGQRGVIDLTTGLRNPPEYLGEYEETSPPTVVNGVVVVGSGIADNNRLNAPSGVVRGFDARTGRIRWSWEPVPQDSGDSAWITWRGPQAHSVGAGNAWSVMSSDPDNDLVFVPTGSASVDYYGGERLGSNLYANSIVALRASTGHKVWHFQLVHHDLWDYDVAAPPLLTTLNSTGRPVPVVIQTGKTAQLFVLDRLTGAPIFTVDERRVPRSRIPGEQAFETQPFSADLPSLVPTRAWLDSAFGLSISDRNDCKMRMSQLRYEGPFTPPSLEGSLYSPSQIGGAQWGGLVYDPERSIVVLPVNRLANAVQLIPRAKYDSTRDEPGWQYTAMTGTPYVLRRQILTGAHGLPCTRPPFSTLVAISLRTRRKVWEIPLGDTRLALRIADDSAAVDSRWGTPVLGGPIATAGGIVFIAGTSDNLLRGIDIDTGTELWRGSLPGRGKATPMTYYSAVTKKQYVVVAAGAGNLRGKGATIVAFALP